MKIIYSDPNTSRFSVRFNFTTDSIYVPCINVETSVAFLSSNARVLSVKMLIQTTK